MLAVCGDVFGPSAGVVVKVQLPQQIIRPRRIDLLQRAKGEDLHGRVVGPHGGGKAAEVVRVRRAVMLVDTDPAEVHGRVRRAAVDRCGDERGVGGRAEGAGHGVILRIIEEHEKLLVTNPSFDILIAFSTFTIVQHPAETYYKWRIKISDILINLLGQSAFSAAILAMIAYLFRSVISGWLNSKFQINSQNNLSELNDRLAREREEISDLRNLVISKTRHRNEKLVERQILAAESIWAGVKSNNQSALAAKFLQKINIEKMDELITSGKSQEFAKVLTKSSGIDKFLSEIKPEDKRVVDSTAAQHSRPFVSTRLWDLFVAHTSISNYAILVFLSWKSGLDTSLLSSESLLQETKKALPHQVTFLEEYGIGGSFSLLSEIEDAICKEIKTFLAGDE